jgi:hypothetical protein
MKASTMPVRAKPAAAAVLAVALAVLGVVLFRPHSHPVSAPPPVVATTPTATVTPTPQASPVAVARPARPKTPHDVVPAAAPTAFEMKGPAFDIKARVCQMPNVRPLDPPGDQLHTVCWVDADFGVAPGSRAQGTSYVLGHAWAEAQLVLNPFSEYAMKHVDEAHPKLEGGVATNPVQHLTGYRITLQTPRGTLNYAVKRVFTVRKADAGSVPSLMAESTPNRIVLITCGVRDGMDVDVNVVAYAYLVSSRAAHAGPAAG